MSEIKEGQKKYFSSRISGNEMLQEVKKKILSNVDLIAKAYELDASEEFLTSKLNAQFELDDTVSLDNFQSDTFKNEFGKVTNLYVPYGVLGLASDCNLYTTLRIILLAIYTKNGLVIDVTKNVGSIFLIVEMIHDTFSQLGLDNIIATYHHEAGERLENTEELDGMIYIGKKANAERIRIAFGKKVIYSGCGNYELYVEDNLDSHLLEQASHMRNIKIFAKEGVAVGQEVSDLEEAIARINESGNEYGVSIITESRENAKIFVNAIKARNVLVNALPTIVGDKLDIMPLDLMYQKSVLVYD